jgi:hypothetical protein
MWDASKAHYGCGGVVDCFGTEGATRVVALSEEHRNT